MAAPGFWDKPDSARRSVEEMKELKRWTQSFLGLRQQLDHALEMADLLSQESDEGVERELAQDARTLAAQFEALELQTLMRGPEDHMDALVTIHPGAGGTE